MKKTRAPKANVGIGFDPAAVKVCACTDGAPSARLASPNTKRRENVVVRNEVIKGILWAIQAERNEFFKSEETPKGETRRGGGYEERISRSPAV